MLDNAEPIKGCNNYVILKCIKYINILKNKNF